MRFYGLQENSVHQLHGVQTAHTYKHKENDNRSSQSRQQGSLSHSQKGFEVDGITHPEAACWIHCLVASDLRRVQALHCRMRWASQTLIQGCQVYPAVDNEKTKYLMNTKCYQNVISAHEQKLCSNIEKVREQESNYIFVLIGRSSRGAAVRGGITSGAGRRQVLVGRTATLISWSILMW
jgi:hypothetical protein